MYKRQLLFVLIQRTRGNFQEEWVVPDEDTFNDVVNEVICGLTEEENDGIKAYAWSDPRRGVIALKTASKSKIEVIRDAIRDWGNGNEKYEYETYLNDAIVEKYSVTVLLRRNFRTIKTEKVASHLFRRNKQLRG